VFGRFVCGHEWSLTDLYKFAVELTDARRGNSRGEKRARVRIAKVCAWYVCGASIIGTTFTSTSTPTSRPRPRCLCVTFAIMNVSVDPDAASSRIDLAPSADVCCDCWSRRVVFLYVACVMCVVALSYIFIYFLSFMGSFIYK
jgi:hypothetical protein